MAVDPTIPSFIVTPETQIDLIIPQTDAIVNNQGYTYDQATFTYNQAGIDYGGVQGINEDLAPVFFNDTAGFITPSLIVSTSDASLVNQNITYNQATDLYNQVGLDYGGIQSFNQDVSPIFFNDTASFVTPSISAIVDIYAKFEGGPKGQSVGPGFWMYITHD